MKSDRRINRALPRLLCVGVVALAGAVLGTRSTAQDSDPVRRTLFDSHDESGVPGKEIVTGIAELPAGTAIGWHVHSGDEVGYVLRGSVVLETRGQPDRELKAGDSFFNPRGAVHSMVAGPEGGAAYSTWIVDKGKPLVQKVQ
jgi:quercetin dioxygenase-like cupin family protein